MVGKLDARRICFDYKITKVNFEGEQHKPEFKKISLIKYQ